MVSRAAQLLKRPAKLAGAHCMRRLHTMPSTLGENSCCVGHHCSMVRVLAPGNVGWSVAMCGIAGLVDWRAATSADGLRAAGVAMNETLRHRGPDDGGIWAEAESGVVLGQRRLAIIDLSPGGAQPMHSADRR